VAFDVLFVLGLILLDFRSRSRERHAVGGPSIPVEGLAPGKRRGAPQA
jgi:hypothetical protein